METKYHVLYEALKQDIDPLKDSILDCFDEIYNLKGDDDVKKEKDHKLSDLLYFATTVAEEVEAAHDWRQQHDPA